MSGILNKLGLGHSHATDSSASSSSSSSTTSHSTTSHTSHTTPATTSTTTGYNTVNKTGYADATATTSSYAHTNPGAVQSQTTTTTTTTTAAAQPAYGASTTATTGYAANTAADSEYMTRSEERLLVGKEQVGAGVASLNKYVTSEHVHTAVPITREHVVIEREPITAADNIRGATIGEAHIEVALTEERAVAAKETVAVEKVKLRKEVEHTTQNVDAELRKEHIEFGTTNETTHGKVLGNTGYTTGTTGTTSTTTTGTTGYTAGSNVDPVANPRV